jgi:hypothetical protein
MYLDLSFLVVCIIMVGFATYKIDKTPDDEPVTMKKVKVISHLTAMFVLGIVTIGAIIDSLQG